MSNRVRGIRQKLPSNVFIGRGNGNGGPSQAIPMSVIANHLVANGVIPVPGAGSSLITAVDSNFTVTSGTLSLHTVADGDFLGNISGSTAEPTANTLTAALDHVFGNTEGNILQRGSSAWQVLAPGTSGQVLTSGGAAALNSWMAASSGISFNSRGAWSSTNSYAEGDVVTYLGSAYLCYSAVSAPGNTPEPWTNPGGGMTLSTTVSTNDTADSTGVANAFAQTNINGKTTGKWYFEFKASGWLDNGTQVGVCTSAGPLSGNQMGALLSGIIHGNGAGSGTGSFAGEIMGDRGAIAIDLGANTFYVCENVQAASPNWNGSSGNSPGAGIGGVSMGSMGGALFKYFYIQGSPSQITQLFTNPTTFLGTLPAGFSAWVTTSSSNPSPDVTDANWLSQGAIVVGTTEIEGGTTGHIEYNNGGVVGEYAISGSGSVAMTTSPTLVTPALGTPSALVLTNATGLVTAGINASQVTYAKIQNETASTLLGNPTGSAAAPSEITLGAGLAFSGSTLKATGTSTTQPTLQTFTSGSGTYTTPAGVSWIRIRLIGAGGPGGGGGNGTAGTTGGNTTFGTSLLQGSGGTGGSSNGAGAGGAASGGNVANIPGNGGAAGGGSLTGSLFAAGGDGGPGFLGGGRGGGGSGNQAGQNAATNSGAGGGGGGVGGLAGTASAGGGGGAGGQVEHIINSPSATYSYAVGAGQTGAASGEASAGAGGNSAAGYIVVEEHYNP